MTACTARVRSGMRYAYKRIVDDAANALEHNSAPLGHGCRAYLAGVLMRNARDAQITTADLRAGRLPPDWVAPRRVTPEQVQQAIRFLAGEGDPATQLAIAALDDTDHGETREDWSDDLRAGALPDGWELAE